MADEQPSMDDLVNQYKQSPGYARAKAGAITQGAIGDIQAQGGVPSMKDLSQIYQDQLKSTVGVQAEAEKQAHTRSLYTDEDAAHASSILVANKTLDQLDQTWNLAHEQSGKTWGNPILNGFGQAGDAAIKGVGSIPYVGGIIGGIGQAGEDVAQGMVRQAVPAIAAYDALSASSKSVLNAGIEQESKQGVGSKYNQMIDKLPTSADSPESKSWILNGNRQILQTRLNAFESGLHIAGRSVDQLYKDYPDLLQLKNWTNPNLAKVEATQPTAAGGTVGAGTISPEGMSRLYQGAKPQTRVQPNPGTQGPAPASPQPTKGGPADWMSQIFGGT